MERYQSTLATEPYTRARLAGGGRSLLVIVGNQVETFELPAEGTLTIGRVETAEIRINHPSLSRAHTRLIVGERVWVEDLGSQNGTVVRGQAIEPGTQVELFVNDVVDLGAAMVVLQGGAATSDAEPAARRPARRDGFIAVSPAMVRVVELAERIAASSISVLLLGETGAGKEMIAALVHRASSRAAAAYLRLNCAALSPSLLESELFGHEKGSFTGATQAKTGLFESADGGTIFLDEVGEMPLELQAKLLRVLDSGEVLRVGATQPRTISVRLVSATNRDLARAVEQGAFRQDLFFRLNGIAIVVPPLRDRRADILPLAEHFLERWCERDGGAPPRLGEAARAALPAHAWPGNVRELRNTMERAAVLAAGQPIEVEHLGDLGAGGAPPSQELAAQRDRSEAEHIAHILEECAGNQTLAAERLGISRATLIRRLDRFGLHRPRKGQR